MHAVPRGGAIGCDRIIGAAPGLWCHCHVRYLDLGYYYDGGDYGCHCHVPLSVLAILRHRMFCDSAAHYFYRCDNH